MNNECNEDDKEELSETIKNQSMIELQTVYMK